VAAGIEAGAAWARVARPTAAGARQAATQEGRAVAATEYIGGGGVSAGSGGVGRLK